MAAKTIENLRRRLKEQGYRDSTVEEILKWYK